MNVIIFSAFLFLVYCTDRVAIVDAGSSGSRCYLYSVIKGDDCLPNLLIEHVKKISPGLSSFYQNGNIIKKDLVNYIDSLLSESIRLVALEEGSPVSLFIYATAGLRLVPFKFREIIFDIIFDHIKYSVFHVKRENIKVISGEEEGIYGWLTLNYLSNRLKKNSLGIVEMGGASAQLSYEASPTVLKNHYQDLFNVRLQCPNRWFDYLNFYVFSSSFLGFGSNQAQSRHFERLIKFKSSSVIFDPCTPKDFVSSYQGTQVVGTGILNDCLILLYPLLNKTTECLDPPCYFNGVHAPSDLHDISFVGLSEFFYTTNDMDLSSFKYSDYFKMATKFCVDWKNSSLSEKKLSKLCFKTAWIMSILFEGFEFQKYSNETFDVAERVNERDLSWTLGTALCFATNCRFERPRQKISILLYLGVIITIIYLVHRYYRARIYRMYLYFRMRIMHSSSLPL